MTTEMIDPAVWNSMDPRFQAEVLEAIADPPPAQLFSADPGNGNPGLPWISVDSLGNLYVYGHQVTSAALAPSGDTSGVTDVAAINSLITAGATSVQLGPGKFYIGTPGILPVRPMRIFGQGVATIVQAVSTNLIDFAYNFINGQPNGGFEMDHMVLNGSGGHVFTRPNLKQAFFHDLTVNADSTGTWTIWNQPQDLYVDVLWQECVFTTTATTRTLPTFYITNSTDGNLADALWQNCTFTNQGYDNTQYEIYCAATGSNTHGSGVKVKGCYFESPYGGIIKCLSITGPVIEDIAIWDIYTGGPGGSQTVGNSLIFLDQSSGAAPITNPYIGKIRRSRTGPDGSTTWDVWLGSSTLGATIEAFGTWLTSTNQVFFNFNSCSDVTMIECGNEFHGSTVVVTNPSQKQISISGDQGIAVQNSTSGRGSLLNIIQNASAPGSPGVNLQGVGGGDRAIGSLISTDTVSRHGVDFNGKHTWGPGGSTPTDTDLYRFGAGIIGTDGAEFLGNTTAPSTPTGGGILYVTGGALHYLGSSGTNTTLGPA